MRAESANQSLLRVLMRCTYDDALAGKDATAIFRSFKHSDAAKQSLWRYCIGALDPDDFLVEEDRRCIAEIETVLGETGHSEQTYEAARRCARRSHRAPFGMLWAAACQ